MESTLLKICPKHGMTEFFYSKTQNLYRCKECRKEAVIDKRRRNKIELVKYKGGKCEICGYDKCIDALQFHHKDPNTKEFEIGNGNIRSLTKLKKEADKCVLVCCRCHVEIHSEIRNNEERKKREEINKNILDFNKITTKKIYNKPKEEDVLKIKEMIENGYTTISIAKKMNFAPTTLKRFMVKYNLENFNNSSILKNYTKEQLVEDLKELKNFSSIGRKYGITGNSIKKWCYRNGLPIHLAKLKETML